MIAGIWDYHFANCLVQLRGYQLLTLVQLMVIETFRVLNLDPVLSLDLHVPDNIRASLLTALYLLVLGLQVHDLLYIFSGRLRHFSL